MHNTFSEKVNCSLMSKKLALRKFNLPEQHLSSTSKMPSNQNWYTLVGESTLVGGRKKNSIAANFSLKLLISLFDVPV